MPTPFISACAAVCAFSILSSCSPAHTAAPTSKPLYGAWGFDASGEDRSTKPGDDFFRFVNGAWVDRTQIPSDKAAISLRVLMTDRTEDRLHDIMEQAAARAPHQPGDLEGKVGAFYKSFMDEARVEQLGGKPIAPQLDAIRQANSRDDLAAMMGRTQTDFYAALFNFNIDIDLKDPNRYALYLGQSGLGLPDRDYYLQSAFASQKQKYQTYVAQLLNLVQWPDAEARARDVVAFETAIADASWTKAQQRDANAVYNPMSVAELQTFAPGFPWRRFLAEAGLTKVERVVVSEKSAFPRLTALYGKTPVATLQAWQAFHVADNAAPYMSKPFTDAYFDMRERTLQGQKEQRVRWKRGVYAVGGGDFAHAERFGTFGTMGYGVGQLYTAKYFGPDAKAKIEKLVTNLKAVYRARIEKLNWMGTQTKAEAIKKLDHYTVKVGYPDHPRDYGKLAVSNDDLVGNVRRAAAADWEFYSGRLFGPVDRTDWVMTPQTNNAYNGSLMDIVFPAGFLQAPVFDADADPAINYGAIGGVIGHELTHGFDDQGRKFDATGALRDWWTKEDAAKFDERAKILGAQYSAFEPLPGMHVNGALTMGENIADLGGLSLALDAYHASLGGAVAPVLDGLTGDQRVFLGWAQAWRGKVTDDYLRRQIVSDAHSPRQYRVNGVVRNLDAWYSAFGVQPGDRLFLAPGSRVHIW